MKKNYQHILFDLDGTIYNTEYAYTMALFDVVKAHDPNTKETFESLTRFMGSSARDTNRELNFHQDDFNALSSEWAENVKKYLDSITMFDGVEGIIKLLHSRGLKLGIITSRARSKDPTLAKVSNPLPTELAPYFSYAISASDVERAKPYPDSILKYMELTGAKREEILFIGDTMSDFECAKACGVDFGLAVWGTRLQQSIVCAHYFLNPYDIYSAVSREGVLEYQWYKYAKEIQAIGQIGLAYCENKFDIERFKRLREIAADMVATMTEIPSQKVKDAICTEKGYITPKLDTRAAVFNDKGQILLVQEAVNGKWSLPGGWCDEAESIRSNTIKEVREEAGMLVNVVKFVGLLDKSKWNTSSQPYHILAAFSICKEGPGEFTPNSETLKREFFDFDKIPVESLRTGTTTIDQIRLCFEAYKTEHWVAVID